MALLEGEDIGSFLELEKACQEFYASKRSWTKGIEKLYGAVSKMLSENPDASGSRLMVYAKVLHIELVVLTTEFRDNLFSLFSLGAGHLKDELYQVWDGYEDSYFARIRQVYGQALKTMDVPVLTALTKSHLVWIYKTAYIRQFFDNWNPRQPILVGHHSEKRDRNYRNKIHNKFGKSFEKMDKAKYYEEKAESIAANDSIFSDDPMALQKLTDKLNGLRTIQEFMKAANKCVKKEDKDSFLKLEFGTENLWAQLNTIDRVHGKGFPHYRMTNNSANIRRIEQRILQLKRLENRQAADQTINGVRIYENKEANRLQVIFQGKPEPETRKLLKSAGFRWSPSEGAWQRHISNDAFNRAKQIAESLPPSTKF